MPPGRLPHPLGAPPQPPPLVRRPFTHGGRDALREPRLVAARVEHGAVSEAVPDDRVEFDEVLGQVILEQVGYDVGEGEQARAGRVWRVGLRCGRLVGHRWPGVVIGGRRRPPAGCPGRRALALAPFRSLAASDSAAGCGAVPICR
jgi:hypothetical protein